MCNFNSENILGNDGCNTTGGLKVRAWWAYHSDVLTFPAPVASPANFGEAAAIASPFVMKAGKYFRELHSDLEMSSFTAESAGSVNSLSASNKFLFKQAGTSKQIIGFLNSSKNKNLVIVFEDLAGVKRVIGSEALPAKIESFNEGSGAKVADEKSVSFTVYAPGNIALFYDAEVPVEPTP